MMMLPIETENHSHDAIILILGKDNLERMKAGDPAEAELRKTGRHLVNPTIMVCYEEQSPAFTQLLNRGDLKAIIEHLQRGWKFRPERGDHDRGPESLKSQN